jgi:hypothetical protein
MSLRRLWSAARRWTPWVVVAPRRYVGRGTAWGAFDFETWTDRYEWREDEWNGWFDIAQSPEQTRTTETGDCEDYALVAASWALVRGRTPVGLAVCFTSWVPVPRHAIAYDRDRVYSSGEVREENVDDYLARTEYTWALRRRLA